MASTHDHESALAETRRLLAALSDTRRDLTARLQHLERDIRALEGRLTGPSGSDPLPPPPERVPLETLCAPITVAAPASLPEYSGAGGGMLDIVEDILVNTKEDNRILFPANLAGKTSYVFGTQASKVMFGDSITHIAFGASSAFLIDPAAWAMGNLLPWLGGKANEHLGEVIGEAGWGLLSGLEGATDLAIGPRNYMTYGGPILNVNRGQVLDVNKPGIPKTPWDKAACIMVALTALMIMGLDLYTLIWSELTRSEDDEPYSVDTAEQDWWVLLMEAMISRMEAVAIAFEKKVAHVDHAVAEGGKAKKQAEDIVASLHSLATLPGQPQLIQNAKASLTGALGLLDATKTLTTSLSDRRQATQGEHTIEAVTAKLVAHGAPSDFAYGWLIGTPKPANVTIRADGKADGNAPQKGLVEIAASGVEGTVSLKAKGDTSIIAIGKNTTGSIEVVNAKPGTITLRQADLPDAGPQLVLKSDLLPIATKTVTMQAVPGTYVELVALPTPKITANVATSQVLITSTGITLDADILGKIEVQPDSVTISVGVGGAGSISVTPTALRINLGGPNGAVIAMDAAAATLTLSFGPTNKITISAQGVSISGTKLNLAALADLDVNVGLFKRVTQAMAQEVASLLQNG